LKISILTTCANYDTLIGQAIHSVAKQDYSGEIEMIVIDDCSEDRSWKKLLKYEKKNDFLKIHRNPKRLYCSSAYGEALKRATGDICCILDGDDALMPHSVSELVRVYQENPEILYIYTQHYSCDPKLGRRKRGISRMPHIENSLLESFLKGKAHCYSHWRTFRTVARNRGELFRPGLKYGVDKYLGFKLEEIGKGGFYDTPLYLYRKHKQNMTHTSGGRQRPTIIRQAKAIRANRKTNNITPKGITLL